MIFATNNEDKLRQIRRLAKGINVVGLKDFGLKIDILEDQATFEKNAEKKAREIFLITKECVLADDSGLCIDFFDGWPGVHTNRFFKNFTAQERNLAILKKMENVDDDLRGAKVVCALALCDKMGRIVTVKGEVKCKISREPKGDNFFGFDSIVEIKKNITLAMLSDNEKEKLNARGQAFKRILKEIKKNNLVIF